MRVAVDTLELPITDDLMSEMGRVVRERTASPVFDGVRDLRLRFRSVKGALLCIAAVGLSGGGLATSTATSADPLGAVVGALDGLPDRIGRATRGAGSGSSASLSNHGKVRSELKKLLDRG